jgi:hypothetical protein
MKNIINLILDVENMEEAEIFGFNFQFIMINEKFTFNPYPLKYLKLKHQEIGNDYIVNQWVVDNAKIQEEFKKNRIQDIKI